MKLQNKAVLFFLALISFAIPGTAEYNMSWINDTIDFLNQVPPVLPQLTDTMTGLVPRVMMLIFASALMYIFIYLTGGRK